MLIIPLTSKPSQTLTTTLGGQQCALNIYQKPSGLYMDVVSPAILDGGLYGVLCENLNRIVRSAYLGFAGDLVFSDLQGTEDPVFTGLGTRFILAYLSASDPVPAIN
jgi:hypothetical protein